MNKGLFSLKGIACFTLLLSVAWSASANEPAFCQPAQFLKHAIKYEGKSPKRLHVFRIGQLTLAGMAVGRSKAADVAHVAVTYGGENVANTNYCTWYLNDGDSEAEKNFTWIDLPKPTGKKYNEMVETYTQLIGDQFDQANINFVSCAVESGYIGMGCNGQMHRGPSVFAMLLGYAGCSPQHSAAIVNEVWGTHGIKVEMREALAQRGAELATLNPDKASQLREMMSENYCKPL